MKKFNLFALLMLLGGGIFFTSCSDDDDNNDPVTPTPDEPSVPVDVTGKPTVMIKDDGNGVGTVTWSKDSTYVLDGFVFVNEGQTLTIQPGTVVRGKSGQGESASALVVARGAKIMAEGTASEPIIFTAESDKLDGSLGSTPGLWGGLIVLGKAKLNSANGETAIEGIPTSETRGIYGGTDDTDNSGTIKYVSIRHGGTDIGAGNEINGLTLGGVGAGTTIDYVEIFANKDDGIEFFGGTANIKHLVSAYCGDDAIDYDEGYRGENQFVLVYQAEGAGDRGGEHDGGTNPEDGTPYATPKFYNVTSVGSGAESKRTITFRDNAGGEYHNSIFMNYGKGIDIEFLASGESSYKRFDGGQLKVENNIFFNIAGNDIAKLLTIGTVDGKEPETSILEAAVEAVAKYFSEKGNIVANPGISRGNVVPTSTDIRTLSSVSGNFLESASYKGAFAPNSTPWYAGWTAVEREISGGTTGGKVEVTIKDDGNGTGTTTWTKDKIYLLDGFVFVNEGQTLTIEAGTVIKGLPGQGENASALVVARGAKIMAEGTANEPIIFTAQADNLTGNIPASTPGLWGGLIVLGKAKLNSANGETAIEGIPTSETRGIYGGTDDTDNSGTIKYVSIRHGGTDIGAGNEINGLTLGGVGAGTTIDYIEIFANKDDGIEFFGGTASIKHGISAYCGDDAIDYDEGYRGKNQFMLVYQAEGAGDRGGEHDGGTNPEDGTPYATPMFMNVTSIGSGSSSKRTITFRDNAGGEYHNSIFINYGKGIDIEFLASGESSYKRFQAGQLKLENNVFFNIASNDANSVFTIGTVSGKEPAEAELTVAQDSVKAYFGNAGNVVSDLGITRSNVVPASTSGTLSNPNDDFFDTVDYKGAFEPTATPWYSGWAKVAEVIK